MKSNKIKAYIFIMLFFVMLVPLFAMDFTPDKESEETPKEQPVNSNVENELLANGYIESVNKDIDVNLEFELPIKGASGYASINISLKEASSSDSKTIVTINKGEAFTIISESNNWWYIDYKGKEGFIENTFCMINLPDVIPSIIYDDSNSYKSVYKSSGYDLPNVTGEKLYDVLMYNNRLEKNEFVMPVLYSMAKKIYEAQQLAIKNGDSLKIYETYRPYEVQMKVKNSLKSLASSNKDVRDGINIGEWSERWFISQNLSDHQLGVAMDTSLVKVNTYKIKTMGKYKYIEITGYIEYDMPTTIHELSAKSAVFKSPVSSKDKTAWKNATLASDITDGAIKLQGYATEAGLTPLASEWWHFNDLDTKDIVKEHGSNGQYYLSGCTSIKVLE